MFERGNSFYLGIHLWGTGSAHDRLYCELLKLRASAILPSLFQVLGEAPFLKQYCFSAQNIVQREQKDPLSVWSSTEHPGFWCVRDRSWMATRKPHVLKRLIGRDLFC